MMDKASVQKVFDEVINPAIADHGGFVELVDVKDSKVILRMTGGCQGCGAADATLRQGIASLLQQHFPEFSEIVDHTDHEAGTNPYYA